MTVSFRAPYKIFKRSTRPRMHDRLCFFKRPFARYNPQAVALSSLEVGAIVATQSADGFMVGRFLGICMHNGRIYFRLDWFDDKFGTSFSSEYVSNSTDNIYHKVSYI